MNQKQYDILKIFTDWPKADLKKVSEVFKLDYVVVMAVASSYSYQNFLDMSKAGPGSNFMDSIFGGRL